MGQPNTMKGSLRLSASHDPAATTIERLPTLDGWRAIAVLAVIACHGLAFPFSPHGSSANALAYDLTRHGAIGVDIFFAISGFLMGSRLGHERRTTGRINMKRFYIRRLFRILPCYWLYLAAISAAASCGLIAFNWAELLSCLLFYRNYLPDALAVSHYTGHLWSLSVEEHFYFLLPLMIGYLPSRWTASVVGFLAIAVALWRSLDFHFAWIANLLPTTGFYTRTDVRLDGLLIGACFALCLLSHGKSSDRESHKSLTAQARLVEACKSKAVWWTSLCLSVAVIVCQPPLSMLWLSLFLPLLLIGTMERPHSFLGQMLESKPARWIGDRSYSLYVWQSLFLVGPEVLRPLPFGLLQDAPWNFFATFAVGALSYRFVEKPLIAMGRRLAPNEATKKPRDHEPREDQACAS